MKLKILLSLFGSMFFLSNMYAQQRVKGKVYDLENQEMLTGVTILVPSTKAGCTTDRTGRFELIVPEGEAYLQVSFVGYVSQTVSITSENISIGLEPAHTVLNQVIVSASRDAQLRTDAPIAISTLSTKLLDETKATSLEQVLNKTAGVLMVDLGNEQHAMSVRQPMSMKSLFLYLEDGLPVRPTGIFNHNALMEMNMAMLHTIEVIRGPASSLYGSEAIGGAMNFITQRPPKTTSGKVSFQGDSYGYLRTDMKFGTTTNSKVGLNIGGYYAQRKEGFLDYSDFHKLALTATMDYPLGEKTTLKSTTTFIDYFSEMGGSVDSTSFYEQAFKSLHSFTERDLTLFRTQVKLDHQWNTTSNTSVRVVYRNNTLGQIPSYFIRNNWTNPLKATGEINESSFQSYGALIQHNQALPSLKTTLRTGLSLDMSPTGNRAKFIEVERDENGRYTDYTRTDSLLTRYNTDLLNLATYVQLEVKPTKRLQIVAALRYDRFRYDYDNHLSSNAFSGAPDAVNHFEAITPKVGLTYDLGKGFGAYGNYSWGFVPPQVSEMYRGESVPTLNPSTYYNYEIGGWMSLPSNRGYLDISLYRMDGTDEIISMQQEDGSYRNKNAGKTLHQGLEYTLKLYPVKAVEFRLSGTNVMHRYIQFNNGEVNYDDHEMQGAPSFIGNAELAYRPGFIKGFNASLEWQYVDEYFMDAANTERYEGYQLLNLRMGYSLRQFEAWLHIMNLTDERYATRVSKSAWGKSYSVGAPLTFQWGVGYKFHSKNNSL
ncbi:TonB-dependent receptor [Rapidithrix thailandica]|uniref:TonB-dependent receptor n=1 Tax=Rapidithrix thailandica TaxID=413964 RepID=A0AAW9S8R7_9BACT